jgi:hypothetical protein
MKYKVQAVRDKTFTPVPCYFYPKQFLWSPTGFNELSHLNELNQRVRPITFTRLCALLFEKIFSIQQ